MPELPDLTVYLEHIEQKVVGRTLSGIRLASPFLLRTVSPTVEQVINHRVLGCRRIAKQLVFGLEGDLFVVIHLMISGRLQWAERSGKTPADAPSLKAIPKRNGLAAFDFDNGSL
ncbi:MAG: DNA-formamidopyrimidine glycosylase family protein, partial [Pseudomonadales bacterium]